MKSGAPPLQSARLPDQVRAAPLTILSPRKFLRFNPSCCRSAQRGQTHTGGVETTVHTKNLTVHIRSRGTAKKAGNRRNLIRAAIAVKRDGIVVVRADGRAVNQLGHLGFNRARGDGVHANTDTSQLHRLLFGQMNKCCLAGAVGNAQRAGAQACVHKNAPSRLTAITWRHSSKVVSAIGLNTATPALLINASMRP